MRSIRNAARPEVNIATESRISNVPTRERPLRGASMPRPWITKVVAKMPRAKISECAKLMRRSTPYTSV